MKSDERAYGKISIRTTVVSRFAEEKQKSSCSSTV